jgi:hypothetical protein
MQNHEGHNSTMIASWKELTPWLIIQDRGFQRHKRGKFIPRYLFGDGDEMEKQWNNSKIKSIFITF